MTLHKKPFFYANAPIENYPYVLYPYKEHKKIYNKKYTSAIIDLGVYTYLVNSKDHTYPKELVDNLFKLSEKQIPNTLICNCDYPPINFEHNIEMNYNNIEKTLENWTFFSKSKGFRKVIFSLQFSTISNIDQAIKEISLYPAKINEEEITYIGIGGLCRLMNSFKEKHFVYNILKKVREKYPKSFIHIWGLSLWHLKPLFLFANSFDNSKWTRPISKNLPNHSCKNKEERILFFNEYIKRISQEKTNFYSNQKLSTYF